MITHYMVNADNDKGYKWITRQEWLVWAGWSQSEASKIFKEELRKYNNNK